MASNKVAGIDVLLYVDTGTEQKVLGGQGDATFNRGAEEVDVSSKTDGEFGDYLPGRKSWSIECSGFMVEDDEALLALEQAFENRQTLSVAFKFPSGLTYQGEVIVSEFPLEFAQEDGVSYSLTLTGRGPYSIVRGGSAGLEG